MKKQIIKIFSFWAIISLTVHSAVEGMRPVADSSLSNIQMQKPSVLKIKSAKNLQFSQNTKNKRFAMK